MSRWEESPPPYRVIPVHGDGNCLFRAVSVVLFGSEVGHRDLRARVARAVAADWGQYRGYVVGDPSYSRPITSAEDYFWLMGKDGEYGGQVELACLAKLYPQLTIRVFRGRSLTIYSEYGKGPSQCNLLFSGFGDSGHYDLISFLK